MSVDASTKLKQARALVQQLADALPKEASVAALGVKQKAPYKVQVIRGSLIWRTEEIGRSACDLLERDDVVAGILLTRATIESAAMIWRLRDLIHDRALIPTVEMDDILMKMLMGSKVHDDYPAINILSIIDKMDKKFSGIRQSYNNLSEFAHPNWSGSARSYSKVVQTEFRTEFVRRSKEVEIGEHLAGSLLCAALTAFIAGYNDISELIEPWVGELDPLWSKN